ncbi:hypothetical protein BDK51DRAFT_50023, partial [Blyttiomyces helicus]
VWKYDIPSALWTKLTSRNTPVLNKTTATTLSADTNGITAAVCVGNTIHGTLPDGSFASFNVTTSNWTIPVQPPASLIKSSAFTLNDGKAYFVGGDHLLEGSGFTNATYIYNPGTGWMRGPPYPHVINAAGAIGVADRGFVFGGYGLTFDSGQGLYNDVEVLQSGATAWLTPTIPLPMDAREFMCFAAWKNVIPEKNCSCSLAPRAHHRNNQLVMWGGSDPFNQAIHDNQGIWLFSLQSQLWTVTPPLKVATNAQAPSIAAVTTCSVVGSVLYIWVTGTPNQNSPFGLLHKLDLEALTWISGPTINLAAAPVISTSSVAATATPSFAAIATGASSVTASQPSTASYSLSAAKIAGIASAIVLVALATIFLILFLRQRADKAQLLHGSKIEHAIAPTPETFVDIAKVNEFAPSPATTGNVPVASAPPADAPPAYEDGEIPRLTYRGLCDFQPRSNEECGVRFGDEIIIRALSTSGWVRVDNITTGTSGLAPLAAIDVGKDFHARIGLMPVPAIDIDIVINSHNVGPSHYPLPSVIDVGKHSGAGSSSYPPPSLIDVGGAGHSFYPLP